MLGIVVEEDLSSVTAGYVQDIITASCYITCIHFGG